VGILVGAGTGTGAFNGVIVGTGTGTFVGDLVGFFVGNLVGCLVGAFDGLLVRSLVGDLDGLLVGASDGAFVGVLVIEQTRAHNGSTGLADKTGESWLAHAVLANMLVTDTARPLIFVPHEQRF
jgi:hypothetical protein